MTKPKDDRRCIHDLPFSEPCVDCYPPSGELIMSAEDEALTVERVRQFLGRKVLCEAPISEVSRS